MIAYTGTVSSGRKFKSAFSDAVVMPGVARLFNLVGLRRGVLLVFFQRGEERLIK